MFMQDFLESTTWAADPVFRTISESRDPIFKLNLSLQHLTNLESYLQGIDRNGRGEWHLEFFKKEWEDEPTLENARKWRSWVEEHLAAKRRGASILCGTILLIAQNGIKTVLGPPNSWRHLRGRVRSLRGECVLEAIWHGRNQAAHVEGLTPNGESDLYFKALEQRLGPQFSTATNGDFISELVVRDILGWIGWKMEEVYYPGHNGPNPYPADMLALAKLVGK
jgi:hypothetical protein